MKGILLAGGSGTRLFPITHVINKHLINVYDKPLIYYSLSSLLLSGIREILIIVRGQDESLYRELFGNGEQLGCEFKYLVQENPSGIAEAFIIGEEFIGCGNVALALGDNIFFDGDFENKISAVAKAFKTGAKIFAKKVANPEQYGVIVIDEETGEIKGLEEKPKRPVSRYAVPGLYFYDQKVVEIAKSLKKSDRGELEITDVNKVYLSDGSLSYEVINCDWYDAGDVDKLLKASETVFNYQDRTGVQVACIEEIALRNGWISEKSVRRLAQKYNNRYGDYLKALGYGG